MSGSDTPSQKLAALTVDRLIASGAMKGEDWKSEIDLASMKAANS